jgi:ribose transport system ATP-binding protein
MLVDEFQSEDTTESEVQKAMVGRNTSTEYYKIPDQRAESELNGEDSLTVKNLAREDSFGPVSFTLREGEILGVVGIEGSKKEELGRILAGDLLPSSGYISVQGYETGVESSVEVVDAGIGYIPKDRKTEGVLPEQSTTSNISIAMIRKLSNQFTIIDKKREESIAKEMVDQLQIKTPDINTKIGDLSGGNQQKVLLARWMARESSILVMHNPTQGIDIGAKEEVYELCRELANQGVSQLFISDELPETINLSNRIIALKNGRINDIIEAPADAKPSENDVLSKMI